MSLFGNSGTSTGFGASNNTTKPLFGTGNTGNSGGLFTNSFGQSAGTNTGSSLFGNAGNNLGNTGNSLENTSGGFGTTNQGNLGGSLFGQSGSSNTGNSGGLFGQNSSNTNSGGLFGNNSNPTNFTGNSGGLFGQNSTGTNTNSGGLFGQNLTNTNTNSGGLFGATGNSQTGTTGGLFGNNSNSSNANTGGLFGNANKTTALGNTNNNSAGLFGNTSSGGNGFVGTTGTASGGLFGNTSKDANTSNNNTSNNNAIKSTTSTTEPNNSVHFGTVLTNKNSNLYKMDLNKPINPNSARKLLRGLVENAHNLPKLDRFVPVNLTLSEVERKSKRLVKGTGDETYTKAHYLLASDGINPEEFEHQLETIDHRVPLLSKIIKPSVGGVDEYLSIKRQQNTLNFIEQSLLTIARDFDRFITKDIKIDWKVKRKELRKSYMGVGNDDFITENDKQDSNFDRKAFTRDKFVKYATIIYDLNEARLTNEPFMLLNNIDEVNKRTSHPKSKQHKDIYKILIALTDELEAKTSQEARFAHNGLMDKFIITKSKKYLETQFFQYVEEMYFKDNQQAQIAVSHSINKVRYFIDKIALKDNNKVLNVNGIPIWCLIYYLLRCGLGDDALKYVWGNLEAFDKFDKNFPTYLKHYCQGSLGKELGLKLAKEFNQQFVMNTFFDPYKYCVYKIIGKCDLSRKNLPPSVNLGIEDWLWFHLSIINEDEAELMFENYKLEDLQKQIIELGPAKLNTSGNNPMYFKSLLLVGLYEVAVKYAYDSLSEIDTVHLAIGLNYYGLLNTCTEGDGLVDPDSSAINFPLLIKNFIRSFKISDPKVASQYAILIAISNGGNSHADIAKCHECLRDILLLSREYNLIGVLNDDGEKVSGILEKQRVLFGLSNIDDFLVKIVESCAKTCHEEGRLFDSLLLYQLGQDFDLVLVMINTILSNLLASTELDRPLIVAIDTVENNVILLSKHILASISNRSHVLSKVNAKLKKTSELLMSLVAIRDDFVKQKYNSVLVDLEALDLLPIKETDDIMKVRQLVQYIQSSDINVIRVVPTLLIIVMSCLSQLNYQISKKAFKNPDDMLVKLKTISKNTMIFAGMIHYRMPKETYSLLAQLETELNT